MDQEEGSWKRKLFKRLVFLVENVQSNAPLLEHLMRAKVLTKLQKEELQGISASDDRNDVLIDYIEDGSKEDYYKFLRALRDTKQTHVAEEIEGPAVRQWKLNPEYPANSVIPFLDGESSDFTGEQTGNVDWTNVLEVAALGRMFRPGMLYDVRTDKLIPNETLWNQNILNNALKVTSKSGTERTIEASDTIGSKCSHLGVSAGLKLSFMCGLVDVAGSASYLHNHRSSEHIERVSLIYKATTELKQLQMEDLSVMDYLEVLDKDIATHVVTAILYGGQAVFVFDEEMLRNESRQDASKYLKTMVQQIPNLATSRQRSLQTDEDSEKDPEWPKCTFHGDFVPSIQPTTFWEAARVYKEMSSLIGSSDDMSVPVTVWLHPLENFYNRSKRMLRQIGSDLVDQIETKFEGIQSIEMRCNDLIDHMACSRFVLIQRKMVSLKRYVSDYRTVFQKRLMPILPAIRAGVKDEAALVEIINGNDSSPFCARHLNDWLDFNKAHLDTFNTHIAKIDKIELYCFPGGAEKMTMDPGNDYVVAYTICINHKDDLYLNLLRNCLEGKQVSRHDMDRVFKGWKDWCQEMIRAAKIFRDFVEANSDNSKIAFIVLENAIPEGGAAEGVTVKVYKEGSIIYEDFTPPSQPGIPKVEQTAPTSVVIQLPQLKCNAVNISAYEVLLHECSSQVSYKLIRFNGTSRTLKINQLKSNTPYNCSVRAVSDVGHSHWSQWSENSMCLQETSTGPKPRSGWFSQWMRSLETTRKVSEKHQFEGWSFVWILRSFPWTPLIYWILGRKRIQYQGRPTIPARNDDSDDVDQAQSSIISGQTILITGGSNSTDLKLPNGFDSITAIQQTSNTSFKCFPMPAITLKTKRCLHQSVLINGSVITMGGCDRKFLSSVESIDLRTHAKCDIARMINARCEFATGIIGKRIYVCGGWDNNNPLNLCEYYDIETKKWNAFQNMNVARSVHGGAVLNDTFYITGGRPTAQAVECYNPIANKWTTCPNLNYDRRFHGCAQLEGQIYVCGGYDGIKSCERYDPREGKWNNCADMNQGRCSFAMTSDYGKLYVIGAWDGSKIFGSVEIYEPRNDKWTIVEDAIEPRRGMSAVLI